MAKALDNVVVWSEWAAHAENTALDAQSDALNPLALSRSKVVGGISTNLRFRTTHDLWCVVGSSGASGRTARYQMNLPSAQTRLRYRVEVLAVDGNGSDGGSGYAFELRTSAGDQVEVRVEISGDANIAGAFSPGSEAYYILTRASGVFATRYGAVVTGGNYYLFDLIFDNGSVTLSVNGVEVYTGDIDAASIDRVSIYGRGESVSVAYYEANPNAGWRDERISLWLA